MTQEKRRKNLSELGIGDGGQKPFPPVPPQPLFFKPPGKLKDGWKSTEFWIAIGSQILALLVILRVITASDSAVIESQIARAVECVAGLVGVWITAKRYIGSRTRLKEIETQERMVALEYRSSP